MIKIISTINSENKDLGGGMNGGAGRGRILGGEVTAAGVSDPVTCQTAALASLVVASWEAAVSALFT